MRPRIPWLLVLILLFTPALARAQIVNGDFESGGLGWAVSCPPGWFCNFESTGGNPDGYAHFRSPTGNSGGTGCIEQTFECGPAGTTAQCRITFDFKHQRIDANAFAGRVRAYVDNVLLFVSDPSNGEGWTTVTLRVPCGTHTIRLCLEVDDGNNAWDGGFDNVTSTCEPPIPTEPSTWSHVKAIYR